MNSVGSLHSKNYRFEKSKLLFVDTTNIKLIRLILFAYPCISFHLLLNIYLSKLLSVYYYIRWISWYCVDRCFTLNCTLQGCMGYCDRTFASVLLTSQCLWKCRLPNALKTSQCLFREDCRRFRCAAFCLLIILSLTLVCTVNCDQSNTHGHWT